MLYVAGTGRSGSTLLTNILGSMPGFFAAGELRYIWERGMAQNRLCGCGVGFRECLLWRSVLKEALGQGVKVDAAAIGRQQWALCRARRLPATFLGRHRPFDREDAARAAHVERLGRLYQAVAAVTASRIVVDSSKLPTYGHLLASSSRIDLHVVHLVRDPRAAAHSWMREKALPDRGMPESMQRQGPVKSSTLWGVWNATAETLLRRASDRYLRLRYEDFARQPEQAVASILAMLGEEGAASPFHDGNVIDLATNHIVAGNPDRLRSGPVVVRPDSEWLEAMSQREWAIVTSLTAPLLLRHGYSLGRRRTASPQG